MSIEHNKAVVQRYLEDIINQVNYDTANEIFAADYVSHTAAPGFGQTRACRPATAGGARAARRRRQAASTGQGDAAAGSRSQGTCASRGPGHSQQIVL
jgi:hypothetical protein